VTRELAAGDVVAVPVEGLTLERTLWRIMPHRVQLPPATRALLELLEETLRAPSESGLRAVGPSK
jgi:DNA-binding transcriptional LysR family regulator